MSHESEQQKFERVLRSLNITDPAVRRGFHDYLAKNYPFEKNEMSYQRLIEVGLEYLRSR